MTSLESDSQLDRAMDVEGYKVLPPCVLYGKIGQGGMGAVYRGRHLNLDIDVAVKCLRSGLVESDDQFVVRFRREARAAAQINHQNVIRVFDVAEEKGLHYIVMELVQGETARERVLRKKVLAVGEALEIVYEAAKGLGEAHRKGFIHRDIKPDNIMISSSGQVKVADLGLAKPAMAEDQASMLSGTNLVMGTPQYMPPEQWENTSSVTPAADVWALGATLYYLLVGVEAIAKDSLPRIMQRIVMQPFPDARTVRPDVPADVAALIAHATQQLPGARFQDAQEMATAIEQLATRRQTLIDRDAGPTTQQNTLLSPPPAKTLAKIKFWLDEQGQRTVVSSAAPKPEPAAAADAAAVVDAVSTRHAAGWIVLLAAALVAVALFWWQPWRSSGDAFAAAKRLVQSKQYIAALAEIEQVYAANPSLSGKAERIAELRAAQAVDLANAGRFRESFAQLELSLAAADSQTVRAQRDQMFRGLDNLVQAAWQPKPLAAPAPRQGKIELRGVLQQELVTRLEVGGEEATRAADGSFAVQLDPRGAEQVPAKATLWNGRVVTLSPIAVSYQPLPAPAVALTAQPPKLELVDDQEQVLTVRCPRGAELRIDGVVVERSGSEDIYLHHVRSLAEEPAPIVLVAHQVGFTDTTITVPVMRAGIALKYLGAPQCVDAKRVDGNVVVGDERVQLRGALNEKADLVLVNGQPLLELRWGDKGVFQGYAPLTPGANELRVEAQKRLRQSVTEVVRVTRLLPPVITALEPSAAGKSIDAPSCTLIVRGDAGTRRVIASGPGGKASLARDPTGDLFRGTIALAPGSNSITVEAANALDQRASIVVQVERTGASAAPVITAVVLAIGDRTIDVPRNGEVFLREVATMRVDATDASATVTLNGKPVERSGDGIQFDLGPYLKEGDAGIFELRLDNAVGRSQPFRCKIVFDQTPPEVELTAPLAPVAKGAAFELRGRWVDPSGLQSATVGELTGELSPGRGVARRGDWVVRMAPIVAATDVTLVVEDRAGNKQTLPVHLDVK